MKRILLPALVAAFALAQPEVMAQPTITAANSNFQIGTQFQITENTVGAPEFTTAALAGANQTWNFATLNTTATRAAGVLARSAAPNPTAHPAANMVLNAGTQYLYIENNGTSVKEHGALESTQNYTLANTDPAEKLRFPITYNNTFTDAFSGTVNAAGTIIPRTGNVTVTAEGYGTLVTPAGTFTNVLKLKTEEIANPMTLYSENTITYDWLKEGTRFPLLRMTRRVTLVGTIYTSFYLNTALGTKEELAAKLNLQVFPNPASSALTVQFKDLKAGPVKVSLVNLVGQEVVKLPLNAVTSSVHNLKIDVAALPKGVYLLKLELAENTITKRVILE